MHDQCDHELELVHCGEYLGIQIDFIFTFHIHVDGIVKKANTTHTFLATNIGQCSRKVKQAAYTAKIRPIVGHALSEWDILYQSGTSSIRVGHAPSEWDMLYHSGTCSIRDGHALSEREMPYQSEKCSIRVGHALSERDMLYQSETCSIRVGHTQSEWVMLYQSETRTLSVATTKLKCFNAGVLVRLLATLIVPAV